MLGAPSPRWRLRPQPRRTIVPATRLERDALMAILQHPEAIDRGIIVRASQVAMANASLAVVRDAVAACLDAVESRTRSWRVIAEVPAPFSALVKELGMAPIPEQSGRELGVYCTGVAVSLIERDLLRRKAELLGRLQRTDPTADRDKYREVQQALVSVETERRALRSE